MSWRPGQDWEASPHLATQQWPVQTSPLPCIVAASLAGPRDPLVSVSLANGRLWGPR